MTDPDQPKIIVDDDWKSAAQAEKEKLRETDQAAREQKAAAGPPEQLTFDDLIKMFASQALMYLGAFPDPQTGRAVVALDIAKLNIDLLGLLQDKTKGNLSEDEKKLLDTSVHELRLQFIEISKAVEQAGADGTLEQAPPPGGPGAVMPG